MVYDYFADYAKKAAHLGIEYTFPRNATIAVIAGGVGWYAYQCGMTFGQERLRKTIENQFQQVTPNFPNIGGTIGTAVSPLIVPWLCPYLSTQVSVAASVTTSFTLNMIAQLFFGTKANKDGIHPLPDALKAIGVEAPPSADEQAKKEIPLPVPFKEPAKVPTQASEKGAVPVPVLVPEQSKEVILEKPINGWSEDAKEPVKRPSRKPSEDLFDNEDPLIGGWCCC